MGSFDYRDPVNLDQQLTEAEQGFRGRVIEFVNKELRPQTDEWFTRGRCDKELFRAMGRQGFLGATLSEEFGGQGASYVSYGLAAHELEAADSGFRTMLSVQSSLVIHPIATFGNDEQKSRYLPGLVSGEQIGCFGLTETGSGSDPMSMSSTAKKARGGFRLSGSKAWISNAPIADVFIVWARSEAHDGAIRGFILQRGTAGLSTRVVEDKMSMRVCPTGTIGMEDVLVGNEALLPGVSGLKGPFSCLNMARYGIGWGALGAARDCLEAARDHGLSRVQFGRPLAATQLYQIKLANMLSEIALGMQLALRMGRLLDEGNLSPEAISLLKRNNCRKALAIARDARDMHGANGISLANRVMRHMVNLEAVNTYEGTEDVHGLILGRAITGHGAF